MKIKNPNYQNEVQTFITDHKGAIEAYLMENSDKEFISFDAIRADFPSLASQLTDGMLHAICNELGIKVEV